MTIKKCLFPPAPLGCEHQAVSDCNRTKLPPSLSTAVKNYQSFDKVVMITYPPPASFLLDLSSRTSSNGIYSTVISIML